MSPQSHNLKHIFWDCKLFENQRAKLMDILSQNDKKEYPKSVTELLRLEEKRFMQGVCYFINKIPIFIYKEKIYAWSINSIFLELRDIFKIAGRRLWYNKMFIRMCYRGPDEHCLGLFCIYIYLFQNKIKKLKMIVFYLFWSETSFVVGSFCHSFYIYDLMSFLFLGFFMWLGYLPPQSVGRHNPGTPETRRQVLLCTIWIFHGDCIQGIIFEQSPANVNSCPATVDANSGNRPTVPHAVRTERYIERFRLTLSEGRELSNRMMLFLPPPTK
jgi:hypothetical protein